MAEAGRWALRVISVILVFWTQATVAQVSDGSRVALVIGNAAYQGVPPLTNPTNDATAVGAAFERLGFDVTLVTDLDYDGMRREIQAFEEKVATAQVAVVYYAGHGIEMGGTNFLIPVDAELKRDIHLWDEAIRLERVLLSVERAELLRLVILDACRDNPFASQMEMTDPSRSVGRGLALFEPPTQQEGSTILAYAARQGTTAADGDGEHSPFTEALLDYLETPGMEVSFIFRNVRDDVMAATGGAQEPMITSSLGREQIYFTALQNPEPPPVAEGQNQGQTPANDGNIVVAYQAALAIDTVEAWQSFLRYYPTGLYADLARAALNKLRGEAAGGNDVLLTPVADDGPVFVDDDVDPAVAAMAACDRHAAYEHDLDRPADVAPVEGYLVIENRTAALEACRLAVELNPGDRRMLFQLARVADLTDRPAVVVDAGLEAAERGSAAAMALVGEYFEFGTSVEQNAETAVSWYRQSADLGSSDGMLMLGYVYDVGTGVPQDLDESGRWLMRAAEAGNAEAIAAIGYRYESGRGVPVDVTEARYWYERAAEGGDGYSMQTFGRMLEFGEGGPIDYERAVYWYNEAAARGYEIAMTSLGYLYENGLGVEADLDAARNWYERGAAGGDHVGMFALGRLYEDGTGVEQDYERSYQWYSQAALTGEMPYALVRMGVFHDQGLGVEQNFQTARSLWEEAAATGEYDALVSLGYLYEFGRGVPRDYERAARYYVEALSYGNAFAISEFTGFSDSYPPQIRRAVEQFLITEGLMSGKPDGIFDDETFAALESLGEG